MGSGRPPLTVKVLPREAPAEQLFEPRHVVTIVANQKGTSLCFHFRLRRFPDEESVPHHLPELVRNQPLHGS